nr:serine/threonine-protein kinase [Kofleriaceae bacterium]
MPETARSSIDVGSILADTYTIEAVIGRGGMGSVFRASHARLPGKAVAIKVLHADATDAESLARFRHEAEIASRLGHPNIVQVHDFNVLADGTPYLVLEYLVGETLAARLARGPLAVDAALTIVRQVGSALQAAHREGVVHRDLKPGNIFLVPTEIDGHDGEVAKLLDFGISKIRGSTTVKTQESSLLGTPQYMAPEQASGNHAQVDERADIFAFGTIVYEMLAGRPAFAGGSLAEIVFRVVYESPQPLREVAPGVSDGLVAAIEQAMAKPIDQRFTTVSGFVAALTGLPLSNSRAPLSVPPSDGPRTPVPTPRTPTPPPTPRPVTPSPAASADTLLSVRPNTPAVGTPVVGDSKAKRVSKPVIVSPGVEVAAATVATADTKRRLAGESSGRKWLVIVPLVAAAGALAMYLAMHDGASGSAPRADAGLVAQAPVDARAAMASVDAAVAEAPSDAAVAVAAHADASVAVAAHADASVAVAHADASVAAGGPPDNSGAPGDRADITAKLKAAEHAFQTGDIDGALRGANEVAIDPGAPQGQKNEAHGLRGAIACQVHNSIEDARTELRQVVNGPRAHARIVRACKAAGLDLE